MPEASQTMVRAQLEEERGRLQEQLRELGHGPDANLTFDGGFADTSQVTAERGEMEALAVSLTERLSDVHEALKKLDTGEYGRCEGCGKPIAPARLEAMPGARLCMACASKSR
ncbi:MAG TPA: TraR/DksA C4-type zinc finger protein [Acidimicrobiia bacterium]|nr:TraR/DksA C4-type zinc finger protein [Acidimicrobiia bacterium]